MASKTESAQRPGARTDARTKGVGAEGTAAWKATLQGDDWSRLIIGALNTRYWRTCISIAAFQMGGKQKHKAEAQDRVRDLKVRRFTEVRANRENPGVHRTSGRAGPRGHPVRERWLSVWPANAPDPEGTPVAAPIGVRPWRLPVSIAMRAVMPQAYRRRCGKGLLRGLTAENAALQPIARVNLVRVVLQNRVELAVHHAANISIGLRLPLLVLRNPFGVAILVDHDEVRPLAAAEPQARVVHQAVHISQFERQFATAHDRAFPSRVLVQVIRGRKVERGVSPLRQTAPGRGELHQHHQHYHRHQRPPRDTAPVPIPDNRS